MSGINYCCPKCSSNAYETRELRGSGGFWTNIFDLFTNCSRPHHARRKIERHQRNLRCGRSAPPRGCTLEQQC